MRGMGRQQSTLYDALLGGYHQRLRGSGVDDIIILGGSDLGYVGIVKGYLTTISQGVQREHHKMLPKPT